MVSKKTSLVINNNDKTVGRAIDLSAEKAVKIKVEPGKKYILNSEGDLAPENVTVSRNGNDLMVTLEGDSEPSLVLEGYFAQPEPPGLYGVAEDGQLYAYTRTDGVPGIFTLADGASESIALGQDPLGLGAPYLVVGDDGNAFGLLPLLAAGAAAGLVGLAAHNFNQHDSRGAKAPSIDGAPAKPPAPVVTDNEGAEQGPVSSGAQTDDATPTLSGKGEPGSTITIFDNDQPIGTATVGANGEWTFTPEAPLIDGDHSFVTTETDSGGNTSEPSPRADIVVDTTPDVAPVPPPPVISGASDDQGDKTGPITSGSTTDDATPTVSGQGEPGSIITILDKGNPEPIGSVQVDEQGNWSFTPDKPLIDGPHEITATATDPEGNTSEPSAPIDFVVDATAPPVPVPAITDDVGAVTGPITSDSTTDDAKPTVSGKGEPGSIIDILDNGNSIGSVQVDGQGNWSFTPEAPLLEGAHEITTTSTDPAGNVSAPSAPIDFVVDLPAPPAPTIENVRDDVGVEHLLQKGEVTNDARPDITGTAQPGSVVKVYDNGVLLGQTTADGEGKWSVTPASDKPLIDGKHDITATATDAVGQTSAPTGVWNFAVDTSAPAAPAQVGLTDDVGAVTGPIVGGGTTDDAKPTISGKGEPGSTIEILDNGKPIGSVKVDGEGNWSLTPSEPLPEGPNKITTTATDPAGNTSAPSAPIDFVVDTSKVQVQITQIVDDMGSVTGNRSKSVVPCHEITPAVAAKEELRFNLSADSMFAFGKSDYAAMTPAGQAELKKVAQQIREHSAKGEVRTIVRGHADPLGSVAGNRKLSEERARSASRVLVEGGVSPYAVRSEGVGSSEPVVKCSSGPATPDRIECNTPNRRVEVRSEVVR